MFVKGDGFSSIAETHSRRYFNAVIQNDYRQVEPSQQTFQKMSNCFGDEPASWSSADNQYKEFQFSRAMFEDSVRCGHPVTITTKENVAVV